MGFWNEDLEKRTLQHPVEGYPPRSLSIKEMPMVPMVPFYRYHGSHGDHFYTCNAKEIEIFSTKEGEVGSFEYSFEVIAGYLSNTQLDGMVPLIRYWNDVDHFYTINPDEIGTTYQGQGNYGYQFEQLAGYCYSHPMTGWVPLYRYFKGQDHFYTTNPNEIGTVTPGQTGNHGYQFEQIACYISPSSVAAVVV